MGFKCGIVGLPNVGKSTLFNALTESGIAAENYPFCTIDPHVGVVDVPDLRLDQISGLVNPKKTIPTTVQFVDIAGLVKGASEGEGLGNQFLANIRETQAIMHVVRCFENPDIVHVEGSVDPVRDVETIDVELCLSDMETLGKVHTRLTKIVKSNDKTAIWQLALTNKLMVHVDQGLPLRSYDFVDDHHGRAWVNTLGFITNKPVLYVANINEPGEDNDHLKALQALADKQGMPVLPIAIQLEGELVMLDGEDREEFLSELGLEEPGLNRVIRAGYQLLELDTYFTAGPKEVRAWTVRRGSTAPQAAAVIHTDFEKHFIRAEVTAFDDYIACGGESGAKEAGKWRLEGKDYIVQDGDLIFFRTSA